MTNIISIHQRAIVLSACLLGSVLVTSWFGADSSAEGELPKYVLDDFPNKLGDWVGSDVAISDETLRVLGAYSFINRDYENMYGQKISVHIATWLNNGTVAAAPHHPEICYPGAGWQIISRRQVSDNQDGSCPMELIEFKKNNVQVVTAHWFELGDLAYTNQEGFAAQRYHLMGAKRWPATVKVLLRTSSPSIDLAEPALQDFSNLVRAALRGAEPSSDNFAAIW